MRCRVYESGHVPTRVSCDGQCSHAVAAQILSPFIYKATQRLLYNSFRNEASALPTRMREKPDLYKVGLS